MSANPGQLITIYQFSSLFSLAWLRAMTPQTMVSGFKATGVFPLNRRAIHVPGNDALTNTPIAVVARRGGIKYMPFLSKSHQRAKGASDRRGPLSRELCYSPTANDVSAINDPIWQIMMSKVRPACMYMCGQVQVVCLVMEEASKYVLKLSFLLLCLPCGIVLLDNQAYAAPKVFKPPSLCQILEYSLTIVVDFEESLIGSPSSPQRNVETHEGPTTKTSECRLHCNQIPLVLCFSATMGRACYGTESDDDGSSETAIQETVRTAGFTIYPTTFSTIIAFTHSIHQRAPER